MSQRVFDVFSKSIRKVWHPPSWSSLECGTSHGPSSAKRSLFTNLQGKVLKSRNLSNVSKTFFPSALHLSVYNFILQKPSVHVLDSQGNYRVRTLILEDLALWMTAIPQESQEPRREQRSEIQRTTRSTGHSLIVEALFSPEPTGGFTSESRHMRRARITPLSHELSGLDKSPPAKCFLVWFAG